MRALESTFSKRDSVLGIHSGDLAKFRATADSCSTLNFAKSPTSNTAKQATAVQGEAAAGFFRIPRILEEEKSSLRADNALFPSLRDFALAKSWQSTSSKNAKAQNADSRFFTQAAQSLSTPQGKKAESVFSNQPQAAGFLMKSATNLKTQQDSRICDEKTRRSRSFFSKPLLCELTQGRILGRM